MREACSGCGQTFLQENLETCECSGEYCYKCFGGHTESTGHKSLQQQGLVWQTNPNDMRGIFSRSIRQHFFDAFKSSEAVKSFSCRVSDLAFVGLVSLKPDGQIYEFSINHQDYLSGLAANNRNLDNTLSWLINQQFDNINQLNTPSLRHLDISTPLFSLPESPWHKVNKAGYPGLIKAISFELGGAPAEQIEIYECYLSFYPESRLLAFHSALWQPGSTWLYLLEAPYPKGQVQYYALNGVSAPIFECNKRLAIRLNANEVIDYLSFFCFFVQGELGSFYLLASNQDTLIPDVIWDYVAPREATTLSARQAYSDPAIIDFMSNVYQCEASLYYGSCVFRAVMHVQENGLVVMDSETPMTPILPYKLKIPLSIRQN
jgi:hypothetical protein